MGEVQSSDGSDNSHRTAHDLTAFQRTILVILSEEPEYGLAIKNDLEDYYDSEVNHGRLYPNLDDLVERGLVAKRELDKRTNEYALTDTGYRLLLSQLDWEFSKLTGHGEHVDDLEQLLANAT